VPHLRVDKVDGEFRKGHQVLADGTTRLPLLRRTLLGRGQECDVILWTGRIARRNLIFAPDAGAWTVADIGSNNGMWVNGKRVVRSALHDGDVITLPAVTLTFFLAD
jgi:hypothetical protein